MGPKSVVLKSQNKLQVIEKKIFKQKILLPYLRGYDLQNGMR